MKVLVAKSAATVLPLADGRTFRTGYWLAELAVADGIEGMRRPLRLEALGARVRKTTLPAMPLVIEDCELLIAQGPFSAQAFAERIAERPGGGNT